jgi:hypothetical protein
MPSATVTTLFVPLGKKYFRQGRSFTMHLEHSRPRRTFWEKNRHQVMDQAKQESSEPYSALTTTTTNTSLVPPLHTPRPIHVPSLKLHSHHIYCDSPRRRELYTRTLLSTIATLSQPEEALLLRPELHTSPEPFSQHVTMLGVRLWYEEIDG